jgi:hypothetical protein
MENSADKPTTAEHVDQVVTCEIPDKTVDPELHKLVAEHMIHGPCGAQNPACPCMNHPKKPGECSKGFPFPHCEETQVETNGYPQYRRSQHGPKIHSLRRNNKVFRNIDSKWVVPYNPYLLRKFRCHINVQTACSIQSVKYIYKYIYKGGDRCEAALRENSHTGTLNLDEIQAYQDGRYLCAPEACAKLFGFETNRKSHSVQRLPVHLPNQQNTVFEEDREEQAVEHGPRETELTAFFELNNGTGVDLETKQLANSLLYQDIPQHFLYKKGVWQRRAKPAPQKITSAWTRKKPLIGRMHNVPKKDKEADALRALLLHVKGPCSYTDLRTVEVTSPDGEVQQTECETFMDAAKLLGLYHDDIEWERSLTAARHDHLPYALRTLFASILIHCNPLNPKVLWDNHKKYLWDDRRYDENTAEYDY